MITGDHLRNISLRCLKIRNFWTSIFVYFPVREGHFIGPNLGRLMALIIHDSSVLVNSIFPDLFIIPPNVVVLV